jgi:hypothetical protein
VALRPERSANSTPDSPAHGPTATADGLQRTSSTRDITSARHGGRKLVAAVWTFDLLKIHSLDQIRRNRESALGARLIQRRLHSFQIDFS